MAFFSSLGDYELALLLLSAYLHDIGMTPERGKVLSHYRLLLDGTPDIEPDSTARVPEVARRSRDNRASPSETICPSTRV